MAKQERASTWSITINNPTESDEENIRLARQKGWRIEGQKEKGQNGTEHYQLMLRTGQVRFSAVKKQFPRAHIEVARNFEALANYVTKEDTRIGGLQEQTDQYPSLQKLWDMFAEWLNTKDKGITISRWYDIRDGDERLVMFDRFINDKILEGYVVETMAVNPQIRGCIKHYGMNIVQRSFDRQTDRQTDSNNVEVDSITDASSYCETSSTS